MELDKTNKWFYIFTGIASSFILLLGSWWLYLVFKLAAKLNNESIPNLDGNLISMVKWEGFTFFISLISLTLALGYFFYQDHRKTKSLHAFFASLTHELKTPLASIRLQSQVMDEFIEELEINLDQKKQIQKYSSRLLEGTSKLEEQLDKHLQLSRLERDSRDEHFEMQEVELYQAFAKEFKNRDIACDDLNNLKELYVKANPFTISVIVKNLLENTEKHNSKTTNIQLEVIKSDRFITIVYNDHGDKFKGDESKLGKLFYKFNSPQGSGIGLYLIKKLMIKNEGKFLIKKEKNLIFHLSFLKESDDDS